MDEHKVVLSADVRKLKQGFKDATVISENFSKQMERTRRFTEDAFGNITQIKQVSGEIAKQNKLYAEQQRILSSISNLQRNKTALSSLGRTSLAEGNQYSGRIASFKQTTTELEKMDDVGKKVSSNMGKIGGDIDKSFTKGLKSVKRLTIGFLGARSAFMLFRKYLGEYQNQNEDFANKMQLTTNVIVNSLAPAFEFFANIIQYVVIGLARIIELLFNVPILSKTVSNGFKDASKSAKEFNDNLSGLDEISNIDTDASGLSTGIQSQLNALDEFQKKIAEVDEWLKKTGLDKFFIGLGDTIRSIWGWVSQHPWETLLGIGTFLTLKNFILPALMGAGGIAGLTTAFTTLGVAIAGAITVGLWVNLIDKINEAIDAVNHYHEVLKGGVEQTDEQIAGYQRMILDLQQKIANGTMTPYDWQVYQKALKRVIEDLNLQNELIKEQATPWEKIFDYSEETQKQLDKNNDLITEYLNTIEKIPKEYNTTVTADLEIDTYRAEQKFNQMFGGIRNTIADLKSRAGKASGGIFAGHWQPITAYAGGGLPDAGQMFVARESGPEMVGTIGGHTAVINNDQIVASVSSGVYEAVMAAMGGQSDRPIVLNVNGKELAKVTYGDYQEESSRRGANTSIRRV